MIRVLEWFGSVEGFSLACRWPPSHCAHMTSSLGTSREIKGKREKDNILLSPLSSQIFLEGILNFYKTCILGRRCDFVCYVLLSNASQKCF